MKIKCKTSKATIILLLIVTILTSISLVACKTKEEEVPWWKDYSNLEYVFEDSRSEEKKVIYKRPSMDQLWFNYKYDSKHTEEYIPTIKILHKGEEKEFYTKIFKKEYYILYPDGIDWDHPEPAVKVNSIGQYGVYMEFYLNKEDAENNKNSISASYIYIKIENNKN